MLALLLSVVGVPVESRNRVGIMCAKTRSHVLEEIRRCRSKSSPRRRKIRRAADRFRDVHELGAFDVPLALGPELAVCRLEEKRMAAFVADVLERHLLEARDDAPRNLPVQELL